jgi:hypothetical protein
MTDSYSEDMMPDKSAIAEMAADLFQAKLEAKDAQRQSGMTHILRIGQFHLEVVPDKELDIEKIFQTILSDLWDRYGDKLLIKNLEVDRGMHQ